MDFPKKQLPTKRMLEDCLPQLEQAVFTVTDVRHSRLRPEEMLRPYLLPTSAFFYVIGDQSEMLLDEVPYQSDRFGFFHGGKGTSVSLLAHGHVEYYLILYKAGTLARNKDAHPIAESRPNLFDLQYGFSPENPLWLLDLTRRIHQRWQTPSPLRRFYARAFFYPFLHEVYRDLIEGDNPLYEPNAALQAIQFIDRFYGEPLTIQGIAEDLQASPSQLNRLVKKRTGMSPQHYLLHVRLEAARSLLTSGATLKEIAAATGFGDEYHLSRTFKKKFGVSPQTQRQIYSFAMTNGSIGWRSDSPYTEEGLKKFGLNQDKGAINMFNQRGRTKIMAAMLSLTLLLAACGGATTAQTDTQPRATATASQSALHQSQAEVAWPRTYEDAQGRKVVIPDKPQRMAVLYFGYVEYLLALGAAPIATTDLKHVSGFQTLAPYGKQFETMEDLGDTMAPNIEKLIKLEPDLIIISAGLHEGVRDRLEGIAPVIAKKDFQNWETELLDYAYILGDEDKAEQFVAETKTLIAQTRDTLKEQVSEGSTFVFLRVIANGDFATGGFNNLDHYYDSERGLGLEAPAGYPEDREVITLETLVGWEPDYIFFQENLNEANDRLNSLADYKVWNSMNAVKNDRVFLMDVSINTASPLALRLAAREIDKAVATTD